MRFFSVVIFLVAALRVEAAMVRVVAIENGRTITIERNGARESVRLAGVEVSDDARARDLLHWTIGNAWVMVESAGNGEYLVYRSPDALFLNRELVLRGYARATLANIAPELRPPSRYLGEFQPADPPRAKPPVSEKKPPRTGTGKSPRSSKPRSRRARAPAGT